ncbi:MAG TPA: monovalent cation/H+ antiporter complex subunit F [Chloroflexota bacterium]|jgi:multicomponent Na+:H+ antiporter subunit F|nr:monovalent cation/H+ antiporter complex subunit F [Chloroflexota bacterium]
MNLWLAATLGLLLALIPCGVVVLRGGRFDRLVALQLATLVTVLALVTLAIGLERSSYTDLALTLALLAFPGTLAFAITLERWL